MELKDFVSTTLGEIIDGVRQARAAGEDAEGIASNARVRIESIPAGLMQDFQGALYSIVEFDVAVTEATKVDGKAGIDVFSFKAGASGVVEDQKVSRVKFSIPMKFNVY